MSEKPLFIPFPTQKPAPKLAGGEIAERDEARNELRVDAEHARDTTGVRIQALGREKESIDRALEQAQIFGETTPGPDRAGRMAEIDREIARERRSMTRADFMRRIADHPNPDIMKILAGRTEFSQLTPSDFQLFALAGMDTASAVLSFAEGGNVENAQTHVDFAKLKKGDKILVDLGPDSQADDSLLLVDLFPDAVTASAIAIDGEPYTYREPPKVDEAGFFRDNDQNLQIPATVRNGSHIEIVSVSAARNARDRDVRAYRDRMGQTAANRGNPLSNREQDRRIAEEFKDRQNADTLRKGFMLHPQYGIATRILCSSGSLDIPSDLQGGIFTQLLYKESGFRSHIKNPSSSAHGFGQILGGTWRAIEREMLPKYRDRLGLDQLVAAGLMSPREATANPLKFDRKNPIHQLIMSAVYLRAMYDLPKTKDWADAVISYNLPGYNPENFAKVQKAYGRNPAKNTYADYLAHREAMKKYYQVTEWKWVGRDKKPIIEDDDDAKQSRAKPAPRPTKRVA